MNFFESLNLKTKHEIDFDILKKRFTSKPRLLYIYLYLRGFDKYLNPEKL